MWLLTVQENAEGEETAREAAGQTNPLLDGFRSSSLEGSERSREDRSGKRTTLPRILGEAKTSRVGASQGQRGSESTSTVASFVEHIL
jgi:hypothetical protein